MWEPQFGLADRGWRIIAPEFAMDAVRLNATGRSFGLLFGPAVGGLFMVAFGAGMGPPG